MAKKIKRHMMQIRVALARVWNYVEEAQMERARVIIKNRVYWE